MYSDNKIILQILSLLKAFSISKIVISPGSRHYPLTHSMEYDDFFQLYSVVDERSAAFFALGLIQKYNEPVVICCTSGSAVLNYGSAVSEAYYQSLPLLVISVDRFPQLLGQKEDQMIKQDGVFPDIIKYHAQLPDIRTKMDEWYVNRVINEAIIELCHNRKGPVQINFPILEHSTDSFKTKELPDVRKITHHSFSSEEDWSVSAHKLVNKRIMIIWGQNVPITEQLQQSLDAFCKIFNCVILTDKISNCHHAFALENTFVVLKVMTLKEQKELAPDIVFTIGGNVLFNGEIKTYLERNSKNLEHWQIGLERNVCDPFKCLTEMYEMDESLFFKTISHHSPATYEVCDYYSQWEKMTQLIEEPDIPYSQLYAIGKLLKSIPNGSVLHLANSNAVRMGHLFNFDNSIRCFCNRGVNGIDGCMSTAVGYAVESEELVFLIIGDLTFFYDMNALWNRHLSKKMRILLVNNDGGAVMHMPFNQEEGRSLSKYTSAGHHTSAKGWIESLGIQYLCATNKREVDEEVTKFVDKTIEEPILLEIFTNKEKDITILKQFYAELSRITISEKVKRKADRFFSKLTK